MEVEEEEEKEEDRESANPGKERTRIAAGTTQGTFRFRLELLFLLFPPLVFSSSFLFSSRRLNSSRILRISSRALLELGS